MSTRTEFRNKLFATLATLALVSTQVMAQRAGAPPQTGPAGQSVKGADIKGRAPVNKEILKVKLPKAQEATLSNGLRVVLLENHRVPTFTMQMVVLSGGRRTITGWQPLPPPCSVRERRRARAKTSPNRSTRSARRSTPEPDFHPLPAPSPQPVWSKT